MSATLDRPMNVLQARQLLRNTSSVPEDRVTEAERVVRAFYAQKPRRACLECPSGVWSEHQNASGDDVVWACARCHCPASRTIDEVRERQAAERKAADEHLRAADAAADAAPKPRARLAEALAARAEANATVERLERAVPAARAAVSEAQDRHDRAVEVAETSNANSAEHLATSFFTGAKPPDAARAAAAARGELAAAADARIVARNARTLLDGKIAEARTAMGFANDRARKAAYGVLVAERLENLLTDVAQARATYLESAGQLGWLIKTHVIPESDRRAHQFLSEANQPPSTWREAQSAGTVAMEDALASLLADPEAPIQ